MTRHSSVVGKFRCDRCGGFEYDYPKDKIGVSTLKSADGSVEGRTVELCADCVSSLVKWFRAVAKDLVIHPTEGITYELAEKRLGIP